MIELAAVINAGGRGTRLGGAQKALLEVDGARIVDRQLAVLRQLARDVAIVAADPAPFASLGLPVLADDVDDAGCGPIAGIAAALAWSPAPRVLVVACDMPLLAVAPLAALARIDPDAAAVAPEVDGRPEPLCAIYARRCLSSARSLLAAGERKAARLLDVVDAVRVNARQLDPTLQFLFNVNTTADLKNAVRSGKH